MASNPGLPHTYDTTLPYPSGSDMAISRGTESRAWWQCHYCELVEAGALTTEAEALRCAAHECSCPSRPSGDRPSEYELSAYQAVHSAGLRLEIISVERILADKRWILRRTWILEFRTRRAIKREITALKGRIAAVYVKAEMLGLNPGWDRPPGLR